MTFCKFLQFCYLILLITAVSSWRRRRRRACSPLGCTVSQWSNWGSCPVCSAGPSSRSRSITRQASCGGGCAYELTQTKACVVSLPSDCQVTEWSLWSTCTADCGISGLQTRTRSVSRMASCGGSCSHTLEGKKQCIGDCSHCQIGFWSKWSSCSGGCKMIGYRERAAEYKCGGAHPIKKQKSECIGNCCRTQCKKGWHAVGRRPFCHCKEELLWGGKGDKKSGSHNSKGSFAFIFPVLVLFNIV